jgi:putative ABC transport system permease protein
VGEILVVTTFGLLLGLLVAHKFPLLGVLDVPSGIYFTANAAGHGAGVRALSADARSIRAGWRR